MANKNSAVDFEKIINDGRDRKKNETLAAKIFGKDRRASAGPKNRAAGSLASRAGIQKRSSSNPAPLRQTSRTINDEWTHDLHDGGNYQPSSLASRISDPNAGLSGNRHQKRRAAQVARALIRTEQKPGSGGGGGSVSVRQASNASAAVAPATNGNGNVTRSSNATGGRGRAGFNPGMSIRGLAGPFAVMAQNFAPGTTAADIESAMTPVGGIISSCRLLKTSPIVIAEIVFESKEGADNVIETFDNQTADGRVLHLYHKLGGAQPSSSNPPTGPRASAVRQHQHQREDADGVVDGTMGFDEPMDGVDGPGYADDNRGRSGLYSDGIVRSGRGGGGGRGGWGRRR